MDKLASEIVTQGVSTPHLENQNLEPTTAITDRTIRHENPNLAAESVDAQNVPLPSKAKDDEDFDL